MDFAAGDMSTKHEYVSRLWWFRGLQVAMTRPIKGIEPTMNSVVIENPILNSPFHAPDRHFRFDDDGITDDIVKGRRPSSYFVPIPQPKKKNQPSIFDNEWTHDRMEENKLVNDIRSQVARWRELGYGDVTPVTAQLLQYWTNPDREKKLFFCQIEALETAIYITEVAKKRGDSWIENALRDANETVNSGLPRTAFKMATGSGKTVVMAMLIAWQALNKKANPQDSRFSDTFLVVTPGITIRDRLRVLLPSDPENYYRARDIIPPQLYELLGQAKIVISNYHAFQLRETVEASKLTKAILAEGEVSPFRETPHQMVRRVCREFGNKRNIIVLNDEAHHCYRPKAAATDELLTGDDRVEAAGREEEARIWMSGLEAVKAKIGLRAVYDLSATPFFLRGSGYPEGTLFPWVVSDFSLIDAIEAGIVKVPRVPVADNSMVGDQPTYRDLWLKIRDQLPKRGRKAVDTVPEPRLPAELQGALMSLYGNYEEAYRRWEQNAEARERGLTAPVFIVVCNNTLVSKWVYDFIGGWEKPIGDQMIVQAGQLPIFRNDDGNGHWLARPNTILVDSQQLESGAMSDSFKKVAAREIEDFKAEYALRFPGRSPDQLTDEDLLREVMNTVGKAGKLGEHVKCVVSVSMLTEGWDANTVTHILGVRAFGTQLLCEQVVGRALRRTSYAVNEQDRFEPEYAEVYGVPFSFIPTNGGVGPGKPARPTTRVSARVDRAAARITFPHVVGYRIELAHDRLRATFTERSRLTLSTADVPTETENAPIVGTASVHTLAALERRRPNEVAFELARTTLEKFSDPDGNLKPWLFPELLAITKRWITECLMLKDNVFPQLLLLEEKKQEASDRIFRSIVASTQSHQRISPILRAYGPVGSTDGVDFDTVRPVYTTLASKSHVSHVVADTDSWEQKMAQALEHMDEVKRYVRNDHLGFAIPYTINGVERQYTPDFIACMDDGYGSDDLLHLIVEVSGEEKPEKAAKVDTARQLWVPAVNQHGGYGRWAFIEVTDPWNAEHLIRETLTRMSKEAANA